GTAQFTNGSSTVTGTATLFTTELSVGDVLMLQTSPGTVRGIVQSITDNTTLVLTANATATASGGYGRKYIPNTNADIVTIGNSNLTDAATTITLDMNATVNSLNVNTSSSPRSTAQVLTHSGTNSLTIQTDATVNQPGGAATDSWNINAGSATVGGTLTLGTAINSGTQLTQVTITTGTLTVGADLKFNTSNNGGRELTTIIDMTGGAGTLNLGRNLIFVNNRGLLRAGTSGSVFNYNRSASSQTIGFPASNQAANPWAYHNLYCNNTSSSGVTFSTTITTTNLTGDLRVQTGTLQQGNQSITGTGTKTFQVAAGATFQMTGDEGFPTGFGTFNLGSATPFGTVIFENSVSVNVPNLAYGHLQFLSDPTFTLPSGTLTVAGNCTVGNGTNDPQINGAGAGSILTVIGNISILANGRINAADITTINIGGNWSNSGTFTQATSTVVFTGAGPSQPQTIGGTVSETFYNITLNTAAASNLVRLTKSTTISQTLTLTQGGLELNGNILNVTRTNTGAITRTGGYVKSETTSSPYGELNWTMGTTTGSYVFPFGQSESLYVPFTFNITSAGSPAAGSVSVATYHTGADNTPFPSGVTHLNPGDNSPNVVDRFWIITLNNYTTTRPTSTMTFVVTAAEVGTITNLQAQRWSPSNVWDAPSASQTNTATSVTISGVSSYSPWTLSGNGSPLPVEFLSFDAKEGIGVVRLNWITAMEINNDYFTIERSKNGIRFEEVAKVAGAGNSSLRKTYSFVDDGPLGGISYYRLKQTDFDGHFGYSDVVMVKMPETKVVSLYPNPSDGTHINLQLPEVQRGSPIIITIFDVLGRSVYNNVSTPDDQGEIALELTDRLETGTYLVVVEDGLNRSMHRLVVR
ncbi:MAG: T9SS type A sorting domain-containing protein, partial [Bacteroidota bacterium]